MGTWGWHCHASPHGSPHPEVHRGDLSDFPEAEHHPDPHLCAEREPARAAAECLPRCTAPQLHPHPAAGVGLRSGWGVRVLSPLLWGPGSILPHGDGVQPCCRPHPHPTSALYLSQLDQGITVGSLQELATELEQLVDNAVRPCPQG